jgi:hypothetical protein
MWHDAIPTAPKHQHNNSGALGEVGSGVEHDLTFNGIFDRGPEVDKLAAIIVDREGLYEERAQNALLPSYIYTDYLAKADTEFAKEEIGMSISDRLAADLDLPADQQIAGNNHGYADGETTREAFRTTDGKLFNATVDNGVTRDDTVNVSASIT